MWEFIGVIGWVLIAAYLFKQGVKRVYRLRLDMNILAQRVTKAEGKKKSISVAQVKEVLGITFDILSDYEDEVILNTVQYKKKL